VEALNRYFVVAVGGAVGACLRYYLGSTVLSRTVVPFPTATFVINITGSFVIGFFLTLATERVRIDPNLRLAIAVGFVGAYTTFSTFEYETARLIEAKEIMLALLNVTLSLFIGFAAVWLGIVAARKVEGVPVSSNIRYEQFEEQANATDPAQAEGAERDIRDASIDAAPSEKEETPKIKRV
jgi:CrcB protein